MPGRIKRRKKRTPKQSKKKWFSVWLAVLFLALVFCLIKGYFWLFSADLRSFNRLNFVFIDRQNEPLVFSFQEREGIVLTLPAGDKTLVPHGFGEYELKKVYALGELEGKGGALLSQTVEELLAVPIFGYFKSEKSLINSFLSEPKAFIVSIFWQSWQGKLKTNLRRQDLLWLYFKARKIDKALIKVRNFSAQELMDFQDKGLREEALSIEVLNATDGVGLAQKTARFLENSGARVVRIDDADQRREECLIVAGSGNSYTLSWLRRVYPCRVEQRGKGAARAEISLILGQNYWKPKAEKW